MTLDLAHIRDAIAQHGSIVRVVVAGVEGSAPREVGAAMLVWQNGQSGTIGGGTLEFEAAARARQMSGSSARIDRLPLGPALGQCCGGSVTLVSEILTEASVREIQDGYYLRRVAGENDVPLNIKKNVQAHRNAGMPIETILSDGWLIEPIKTAGRPLWIFGAGHVGRALVNVLEPLPDFAITWVDTGEDRFPGDVPATVTKLIAANPAEVVRYAPTDAEHLILTYSHALDLELCHQLLHHGFQRAGLIGSKSKWARFRSKLRALGHTDAQINRIDCPIGDPTLGKHPQAIAVGVAGALLSAAGKLESVRDKAG